MKKNLFQMWNSQARGGFDLRIFFYFNPFLPLKLRIAFFAVLCFNQFVSGEIEAKEIEIEAQDYKDDCC